MDGLRQKLESQGLTDVTYMVINHQGEQAQRLHPMLAQKLSDKITLYKQEEQQPDIWQTLGGNKDDFLIYDRCGRLTRHISLPYSFIGEGHVETAITDTYNKRICGECTPENTGTTEESTGRADAQSEADSTPAVAEGTGHGHHRCHHQGHGHGHHGDSHDFHPRGLGRGHSHDHGQSQHGLTQQGQEQDGGVAQMQQHADLADLQQAVHTHHMSQQAHGGPMRP